VDEQETALFEQEFLNRWTVGNEQVIPEALWRAVCGDYRPDEETTLFLGVEVAAYGPSDVADAMTRLYDGVADQRIRVRSSRGDPLSLAVAGAGKRIIGERRYWGRTSGTVDISPLVVLSLAYDMAVSNARTPEPFAIWA